MRISWRVSIVFILIGLCLGLMAGRLYFDRVRESAGGYLIQPGYPPLIYVPDATTGPRLSAASAVLLEAATGTILYARNEHVRRAPASTTKIMTALLALERGEQRALITVSRAASLTPGSSAGLRAGERIALSELLQALMLRSGNDAARAVAEHLAGGEAGFAALMNRRALELGAFNTRFRNPHGLPALGHYTTAFDLALITRYALQNPAFARLARTKEEELQWADERQNMPISNTNRLLWSFAGADGVKTGTTTEAGHCLVASATRDGRRLIAVVLRSHDRWRDAAALLSYGFESFNLMILARENQEMARIRVKDGVIPEVPLIPRNELAVVCRRGEESLIRLRTSVAAEPPRAPIPSGRILGHLSVLYDGEEIEGTDLLPAQRVEARRWWRWIWGG